MSDFPKDRHEMLRARYRKTGDGLCKGCGAAIEWWKTSNNKSLPMNPIANDDVPVEAHWTTCPNAKQFKGGNAATTPAERRSALGPSLASEVRSLRTRHNARVVVLVDDFGTTAYWRNGIPAEDLRHDLISAGNFVRDEIQKKEGTPA